MADDLRRKAISRVIRAGGCRHAARLLRLSRTSQGNWRQVDGAVSQADFDTVFYPGGHGPLWYLAEDNNSIELIQSFLAADKPIALVCHAPGVLRHVKTPAGKPLVEGKKVTGFTNTEEAGVGLTDIVPFLVEDELKAKGGIYSKIEDWASYVVSDGFLSTGQNPTSSATAASHPLKRLAE